MRDFVHSLWILSVLFVSYPVLADTFNVDNITMNLFLPDGYCLLSREKEPDASFFQQQDKLQSDYNKIISIAVPCSKLSNFRKSGYTDEFGIWSLNAPGGSVYHVPAELSREDMIDKAAASMPRLDTQEISQISQEKANLKLEKIGVIDRDKNAIYLGVLGENVSDKTGAKFSGVSGMTMIRHRRVLFNLYKPFDNQETYVDLLFKAKQVMAKTIADTENYSLPEGMESPHTGINTSTATPVIAPLSIALFLFVRFIFNRWRRKNSTAVKTPEKGN